MSFNDKKYPTLALASNPIELRKLPTDNLVTLCNELRQFLLTSVSRSSGHLASGLGVIELTVALHYVYNTPFDSLIWDIGHQAYPHKILTDRRDMLTTIRQRHGLHPFPWRGESEYDQLSVGHASTAISAGLGMAVAAKHEGFGRRIVCVIGDGSITGGMAFEAMNHAGDIKSDLLVVMNYNEMSISANVGALNKHLAQIISGKLLTVQQVCEKPALDGVPLIAEQEKNSDTNMPGMETSSNFFTALGFNYVGPLDGHDMQILLQTLKAVREKTGPQLIHIMTKKGCGYALAEQDPIRWHAVPKFNQKTGLVKKIENSSGYTSYSTVFGKWLCHTAASDDKLMAITPAMCEGSGMFSFAKQYPRQYFDVAIAEQHAVTFAAGLAIGGYNPVVAIYSTFLQRAYDQIIHDIALQNLPVMIVIDRGGIVGADGKTHQGAFDLSYLRCIPNMIIMTPSDEHECLLMLQTGYCYRAGPIAVRYPRGNANGINVSAAILSELYKLPLGKGKVRRKGKGVAILNFGALLPQADEVAKALNATLVDMRFVKPLDGDLIKELTASHQALITVEENAIMGGAGSSVNEFVMYNKLPVPILNIGLPDHFIPHGGQKEIRADLRLDTLGIRQQIENWLG